MLDNGKKLQYNVSGVGDSARCTGRCTRNTKAAKSASSHHPPAVKVEADVFISLSPIQIANICAPAKKEDRYERPG